MKKDVGAAPIPNLPPLKRGLLLRSQHSGSCLSAGESDEAVFFYEEPSWLIC